MIRSVRHSLPVLQSFNEGGGVGVSHLPGLRSFNEVGGEGLL